MSDNTTLDRFIAARELLSDPKRWTKGAIARDSAGQWVPPTIAGAVCWCLLGAFDKVCADAASPASLDWIDDSYAAASAFMERTGNVLVDRFNDDPMTQHADILFALDSAIALEKEMP